MDSLAPPRIGPPVLPLRNAPAPPLTLWAALPPDVRQQIARDFARMVIRMRTPRPPTTLEVSHVDDDLPR
jgi:hypothetical protein